MATYTLFFRRGGGVERWFESFDSVDAAVDQADSLLEYGDGYWFEIRQDDKAVMDHDAVMQAIVALDVRNEVNDGA